MRLQILELPGKYNGDSVETPFILVISEAPEGWTPKDVEVGTSFRDSIGAAGIFLTTDTVELGPPKQPHLSTPTWSAQNYINRTYRREWLNNVAAERDA